MTTTVSFDPEMFTLFRSDTNLEMVNSVNTPPALAGGVFT